MIRITEDAYHELTDAYQGICRACKEVRVERKNVVLHSHLISRLKKKETQ